MEELIALLQKNYPEITQKGIEDYLAYAIILEPYLNGEVLKIKEDILSPIPGNLRLSGHPDGNASFAIYPSKSGRLSWKDCGLINATGSYPENLLVYIDEGISDYKQGYRKVREILDGSTVDINYVQQAWAKPPAIPPTIRTKERFNEEELAYWDRYWFTEKQLLWAGIRPVDKVIWDSGGEWTSDPGMPRFVYIFQTTKEGKPTSFKIYSPLTLNKKVKFKSFTGGVLEGLPMLRKIKKHRKIPFIIPQSGYKDSLVSTIHTGIHACAGSGEGHYACWEDQWDEVNAIAPVKGFMYDADSTGLRSSKVLAEKFNVMYFDMLDRYGEKYDPVKGEVVKIKDPSDYIDKLALHPKTKKPLGNTPDDLKKLYIQILKEYKVI